MGQSGLVNQPQAPQGQSNVYNTMVNGRQMTQVDAGNKSNAAFRGDLNTNFGSAFDRGATSYNDFGADSDADVRSAQFLTNQLSEAQNTNSRAGRGVNQVATQAQLDAVKARIGLKNSLGQSIASNDSREGQAEDILRGNAGQALGEGIKNTNQNYSNRGLLYSGMREGGVQGVKAGVAGNLAAGLAGTKREYANLQDQQKAAYAAIGQAQQQQNVERANQTFDTVSKNNIARQQAYQQLAGGVGQLGGMAYSSYQGSGSNYDSMRPGNNNYTPLPPAQQGLLGSDYDANSRVS